MNPPAHRSTAVVTVTYNSGDVVGELLDSLRAGEQRPRTVVVVDNASHDAAAVAAITDGRGATFIPLAVNVGYGAAVNRGVASLPPEVDAVLIINPDAIVHPGAVETLLEVLSRSDRAASIGPRILNSDGSVYPSARAQPSIRDGIGHALFSGFWPSNPWSKTYRQEQDYDDSLEREVGWLSGACLLVDRAAFEKVGCFDESYFMYFEDVDLGRKFLSAGKTNVYAPSAVVTHHGAHSTRQTSRAMLIAHHRSAYRYLARRYSGRANGPLRLALRIALNVRARFLASRVGS